MLQTIPASNPTAFCVDFIPSPEFESGDEGDFLVMQPGTRLYSDRDDQSLWPVTQVGSFDGLHSQPLLSVEGEAFLFRKMNYLKWSAAGLQSSLDRATAGVQDINRVENLLADANAVRNHIAGCNLRLVISIARKFAADHAHFDELMSEGNLILLKAIDKFDYSRGFRFSTYATHAVQRHFYRLSQQKKRRLQMEFGASQELLSEVPATESDVDEAQLKAEEQTAANVADRISECLDEREQVVIRERFGLDDVDRPRSLRDVATMLNLSKERVRQIQLSATRKLREFFGDIHPQLFDR